MRRIADVDGPAKPKLAVFKFASCDGCQLSLLDAEERIVAVVGAVDIALFLEARTQVVSGPYNVGLVEGSVTNTNDAQRIKEIRKQCKFLVTIGACATSGGIQALKNWANVDDFIHNVYAHPQYIRTLKTSTPIADHVIVDFELRGCPINKLQLLDLISSLLRGRKPTVRVTARAWNEAAEHRLRRGAQGMPAWDRYPGRLQRDLPGPQSGVFQLLWPQRAGQPGEPVELVCQCRRPRAIWCADAELQRDAPSSGSHQALEGPVTYERRTPRMVRI